MEDRADDLRVSLNPDVLMKTTGFDENTSESNKNTHADNSKRKNFLERNRQAAQKSRQRKKAWVASLEAEMEYLHSVNESLQRTVNSLCSEVTFLKSQLMQRQESAAMSTSDTERISEARIPPLAGNNSLVLPATSSSENQRMPYQHTNVSSSAILASSTPNYEQTSPPPIEPISATSHLSDFTTLNEFDGINSEHT